MNRVHVVSQHSSSQNLFINRYISSENRYEYVSKTGKTGRDIIQENPSGTLYYIRVSGAKFKLELIYED